ncbi:MAG: dockerin type I repeat-containing protein [Clostridia bacterium]|nr:dockerin type I repeat-containing protein [Clostridia bacterium]
MNKLYKRIIAAVSAIMFAASASTAYAAIPKDAIEELENYYNGSDPYVYFTQENKPVIYASLWYKYSDLSEEIPEEYYGFINDAYNRKSDRAYPYLNNRWHVELSDFNLDGNTVTFTYKGISEYPTYDSYDTDIYVAVVNKETGNIVRTGKPATVTENTVYHEVNNGQTLPDSTKNPPLTVVQAHELIGSYMDPEDCHLSKSSTITMTAELPEGFDPQTHRFEVTPVLLYDVLYTERNLHGQIGTVFLTPFEADPRYPETTYDIGDVNKDCSVNLSDVTLTLKYIAEWDNIEIDTTLANINSDDTVNLIDVSLILQLIAGWTL